MVVEDEVNSHKRNIYLVGGGGHCVSCIDVIESTNAFEIKGIFDTQENVGQNVLGYPIVGTDVDIEKYISEENLFLITLGQIRSAQAREKIANQIGLLKGQFATVVSSRAYVSRHAKIGYGTIVMHDARVKDFCHVLTGAIINGTATIEAGTFVGSGAVVKHSVNVPEKSLIQAAQFYKG